MPMWHDGGGWAAWLIMSVSMIAFWALVIWAVVALVRSGRDTGRDDPTARRDDPEQVLAGRYAAGDIDDDEYERRLARLRGRSSPNERV